MRIILLHHSVPPVVGGVESVMGQHARLMMRAGHEVRMVAARGGTGEVPFTCIPLTDSRHPEVLDVKQSLDHGEVPPAFNGLMERLVQELGTALEGSDHLIAHNVASLNKNLPLTAALYELSRRARPGWLILWHHDLAWTTPRYRGELHPGYPWDLLRTDWPGVTQVTISKFRRDELVELMGIPAERVHVVPNGVDAAGFLKLEEQTRLLVEKLNLLEAQPLLLLPVRITPRKNIEFALRTAAALKAGFPEAGLIVTGPPGPHNPANAAYLQRLKDLRTELGLERSVRFLAEEAGGPLPEVVVGDLYRLADALFLPSREEGFGIPVLEAGLAGLPVFCADIPPLRELGEGAADFFALDAEPEEVAALIKARLEANPVFRLRGRVRERFLWDRIYQERIAPLLEEG